MSHREQALEFVRRFAAGDVDRLEPLLAEDLRFTGPYLQATSRAAYLEALRKDPPAPSDVRLLSVTDGGDMVAVFYQYEKRQATVTIAQLFRFTGERISETRVVFDTREIA